MNKSTYTLIGKTAHMECPECGQLIAFVIGSSVRPQCGMDEAGKPVDGCGWMESDAISDTPCWHSCGSIADTIKRNALKDSTPKTGVATTELARRAADPKCLMSTTTQEHTSGRE